MSTSNEVDRLFMDCVRQLSEESTRRAARLKEEYRNCVEHSNKQHSELAKRLDEVTQRCIDNESLMQRLLQQLNSLNSKLSGFRK